MLNIKIEDIVKADLLSIEEAKALPREILANGLWWWLRSPGGDAEFAGVVNFDGTINRLGGSIESDTYYVRPVLRIRNLDAENLEIGETVKVLDRLARYVGNNSVLLCEDIGNHWFDSKSNDYEASDVKKYVNRWLKEALKHA